MRRWFVQPRFDVILHPRDWRLRLYPRGVIFALTGSFGPDGRVVISWGRLGPAMPAA